MMEPETQDANSTQNTQTDSQQAEAPTPGTVLSSSSEPVVPAGPEPAKSKKPLVIIVVLLVLALLAAGAYWFFLKDDTDSTSNTSQQEQLVEEQEAALPEGFELYENAEEEISFIYPSEWGEVTIAPGPEEAWEGHLTAGTERVITFSDNQSVSAGVMSPDWAHNELMGHGGLLYPGTTSLEAVKQANESLDTSQVYINTETQFAYVMECVMFCDAKSPILVYTVVLPDGGKYRAIQFHQMGDEFGQEFYSTNETGESYLDEEKVAQADLSQLFPQSDPRFITLQTIADYMTQ